MNFDDSQERIAFIHLFFSSKKRIVKAKLNFCSRKKTAWNWNKEWTLHSAQFTKKNYMCGLQLLMR